jgi:small subunit ribosomal protein S6
MALYECTFIARQDIAAPEIHKLADKFVDIVSGLGGKLIKKEYWGLRSLAYIIKKNKKGHYIMLGLDTTPEVIMELERNFKINEDVIKFVSIRVEKIDEAPSAMMQAPAKATPGAQTDDLMMQ